MGQVVDGRYELTGRLGRGGMGTVWKAWDIRLQREVAVKEPRLPSDVPDEVQGEVFARMEREARAAARVTHPSVVAIHDVVPVDGRPWIVMELVPGSSLADVLAEGTLPPAEAARVGRAVVSALEAVHAEGVLHRDVKPGNILLGPAGRVVLTDFGISRIEGETPLTLTGFVGSPDYMAPERVRGLIPGPASDLFSLGAVLYRAVEGVTPFHRQFPQLTMQAVLDAEPARPTQAGELAETLLRLLAKEPEQRPSSRELHSALDAASVTLRSGPASSPALPQDGSALEREPGPHPPQTPEPRTDGPTAKERRPPPRLLVPVAALLVGGLLGAAGGYAGAGPGEPTSAGRGERTAAQDKPAGRTPGKSPDRDHPVPESWRTHRVEGATVRLPANFEADSGNPNRFSEPGERSPAVYVVRQPSEVDGRKVPVGSAEETANWYRDKLTSTPGGARQVTVEERRVNGAEVAVLTGKYRNEHGWWRKREMYRYQGDERWKVVLDWRPVQNEDNLTGGAAYFDAVIHSFRPPSP